MRKRKICIIFALIWLFASPLMGFSQGNKSILFFSTEWCGENCQQVGNAIAQARLKAPTVSLRKIDADSNPALLGKYKVTSLPVVIVQEDGKTIGRFVGMASQAAIEKLIVPPEEEKTEGIAAGGEKDLMTGQEQNGSSQPQKPRWVVPAMQKIN